MKAARIAATLVLLISVATLVGIYVTSFHESPPQMYVPVASIHSVEQETNGSVTFLVAAITASTPLPYLSCALQLDQGGYGSPVSLGADAPRYIQAGTGYPLRLEVVDRDHNGNLDAGDAIVISKEGGTLPPGEYRLSVRFAPSAQIICGGVALVP